MNKIRDGDVFKIIDAFGRQFEIRYGYYEDYERHKGDPIPIYPDFKNAPEHTAEGYPFVTQMQDICEHGSSKFKEGYCIDCEFYKQGDDLIGICTHHKNKKKID